jgi:hypothetical protein
MRRSQRVSLLVLSLIVLFLGAAAWSVEDTYGHGLDFTLKGRFVHETAVDQPVFDGTRQEADEYMERRRDSAERDFLLPGAIIALGLALLIAAFLPWEKLRPQARHTAVDGTAR